MRITNGIMLNTQKGNINGNKVNMDMLNTQMSTQKKISRPSDDPIIAVRSLRLRANVAELTQYADKNIEDATSWMEVTEASMKNMRDILKDMYYDFTEGDNDYLSTSERVAILEDLEALVDQFYGEGNSSYAGRTIFSGYKTDSNVTFKAPDPTAKYNITETFTLSQIGIRDYISQNVEVNRASVTEIDPADFPQTSEVPTYNLAYQNVENLTSLTYTPAGSTTPVTVEVKTCSLADGDEIYLEPDEDGVNYIKETGELVFGKNLHEDLSKLSIDAEITVNYDKTGFEKGEVNPVMYFDCKDLNTDPPVEYTKEIQAINYNVGFNQSIKVNTEASDILILDVKKEIANLRDAVTAVQVAEKKKADIESMLKENAYQGEQDQAALKSMLKATEKEIDLKQARMVGLFKKGVGSMQSFEAHVNLQISDMGNRYSQLQMIKTRSDQQKTNFEELMTQNEDRELSDIILDYTAANYAYQLSLQATGNISKLSLLNYI